MAYDIHHEFTAKIRNDPATERTSYLSRIYPRKTDIAALYLGASVASLNEADPGKRTGVQNVGMTYYHNINRITSHG